MSSPETKDSSGIEYYNISSFKFHAGKSLPIRVAYHSFNPSSKKAVCIPTCYGGRINTTLNFTTGALKDYHVIVIAMLGNGESSSPSNTENIPQIYYQDCINSQHELLTRGLGIKELEAVIGFSMGGQQAYYWACMYPSFLKTSVVICGSARTSPHNYAFLEGPKAVLLNSVDYHDGQYKAKGVKPTRGLRGFARAYCAWALSAAWFRERTFEKLGIKTVEDYIEDWSNAFADWDAEDVLVLARMWQAGDVGTLREDGDYTKALKEIKCRVLVMPARTDQYFPYVAIASIVTQENRAWLICRQA